MIKKNVISELEGESDRVVQIDATWTSHSQLSIDIFETEHHELVTEIGKKRLLQIQFLNKSKNLCSWQDSQAHYIPTEEFMLSTESEEVSERVASFSDIVHIDFSFPAL